MEAHGRTDRVVAFKLLRDGRARAVLLAGGTVFPERGKERERDEGRSTR